MAVKTPQTVANGYATLTSQAAITSRANISGTTGLVEIAAVPALPTIGRKVYEVRWKAKGTTIAGKLFIWRHDTVLNTSFLFDEFNIAAKTPSTTDDSEGGYKEYDNLVLGTTGKLFISTTTINDLTCFTAASDL